MTIIRSTAFAFGLSALCAAGLAAQSQETQTTTKTKVEIKGGKNITVVGCLDRRSNGEYVLTDTRDNRIEHARYTLVTDKDLSNRVGQRVEIKGKTVTRHDGKVEIETKTKIDVEHGKDRESKTKTEGTTGMFDPAYLGVNSIKKISSSCN